MSSFYSPDPDKFGHPGAYALFTAFASRLEEAGLASRFPTDTALRQIAVERLAEQTTIEEIESDTRFVAAPHPVEPSLWVVGGGSGHGFKQGPAMAERIATAIASGTTLPAEFSLGERPGSQSLRTASSSRSH